MTAINQNAVDTITWTATFKLKNDPTGTNYTATTSSRVWAPSMEGMAARVYGSSGWPLTYRADTMIGVLGLHENAALSAASSSNETSNFGGTNYASPWRLNNTFRSNWMGGTSAGTGSPNYLAPHYGHMAAGTAPGDLRTFQSVSGSGDSTSVGNTSHKVYIDVSRYDRLQKLPNLYVQGLYMAWTDAADPQVRMDYYLNGSDNTQNRLYNSTTVSGHMTGVMFTLSSAATAIVGHTYQSAALTPPAAGTTKSVQFRTRVRTNSTHIMNNGSDSAICNLTFYMHAWDKSTVRAEVAKGAALARVPQAFSDPDTGKKNTSDLETAINTAITTLGNPKTDAAAYTGPTVAADIAQKKYDAVAECLLQGSGDPVPGSYWGGGNEDKLAGANQYSFGDSFHVEAPVIPGYELVQVVTNTLKGAGLTGPGEFEQDVYYVKVADAYWEFYYKPIVKYNFVFNVGPGPGNTGTPPGPINGCTGQNPPTTATFPVSNAGTFQRTGYTFSGWQCTSATGTFTVPSTGTSIADFIKANESGFGGGDYVSGTKTLTLHAIWTANSTYRVNCYPNSPGGTLSPGTTYQISQNAYTTGTSVVLTSLPAYYTTTGGYVQVGWSKTADPVLTGTQTIANAVNPVTANFAFPASTEPIWEFELDGTTKTDLKLYAVWKKVPHKITFKFNYGAGVQDLPQPLDVVYNAIACGETLGSGPSATPVRTGYTFAGWYDAASAGNLVWDKTPTALPDLGTTSLDKTYHAQWTPKSNYVVYNHNGTGCTPDAPIYSAATYNPEATVTVIANPFTRPGYAFKGWALESAPGTAVYGPSPLLPTFKFPPRDTNMQLCAVWDKAMHTVIFNYNYGAADSDKSSQPGDVKFDGGTNPLRGIGDNISSVISTIPNRDGYTFKGWYDLAVGGNQIWADVPTNLPDLGTTATTKTYYAQWVKDGYKITFEPNTPSSLTSTVTPATVPATAVLSAATYVVDDNVTLASLPTDVFTCTGFKFLGWSATPTGAVLAGTSFAFPANPTAGWEFAAGSLKLYAVWEEMTYDIVFDYNYDIADPDKSSQPANKTYDDVVYGAPLTGAPVGPNPTRTGYTFTGWYNGGTLAFPLSAATLTVPNLGSAAGITYTAKWLKDGYYVRYEPNTPAAVGAGATPVVTPGYTISSLDPYVVGQKLELEGQIFTCPGFKLAGWSVTATGAKKYDLGQVDVEFPALTGPWVLYAVWEPAEYNLTFKRNWNATDTTEWIFAGASGAVGAPIVIDTSRVGYTFLGWFSASAGGTLKWAATPAIVPEFDTAAHTETYYAQWSANSFAVTWDYGYQVEGVPFKQYSIVTYDQTLGAAATVPYPAAPTRIGYTFGGWWTGPNGTGTQVNGSTPVNFVTPQTYYAKWVNIQYEVWLEQRPNVGISGVPKLLGTDPAGTSLLFELPDYGTDFMGFWRIAPIGTGSQPVPYLVDENWDGKTWAFVVTPPANLGITTINLAAIYDGQEPTQIVFDPNGGKFGATAGPGESSLPSDYLMQINEVKADIAEFHVARYGYTFLGWKVTRGDGRFEGATAGVYDADFVDNDDTAFKAGSFTTTVQAQWKIDTDIDPFNPLKPPFDTYDPDDPSTYNPPPIGDPDGPGGWPNTGGGGTGDGDFGEILWPPHDLDGNPIPWPPEDMTLPAYGEPYENLPALGCYEQWHFLGYFEPSGRLVKNGDPSQLAKGEVLSVVFVRKYPVNFDANGGVTDRGEAVSRSVCVVYGHELSFVCGVVPKDQADAYKTTHSSYFPSATRANDTFQGWFTSALGGSRIFGGETVGNLTGAPSLLRDSPLYSGADVALPGLTGDQTILGNATYYAQWYHNHTWWDEVTDWFNAKYNTSGYNIPGWIYTCDLPHCLKVGLGISLPFLGALGFRVDKISNWSRGCLGFWGVLGLFWLPVPLLFSCIYPVIRDIMPGWWPDWRWIPFSIFWF